MTFAAVGLAAYAASVSPSRVAVFHCAKLYVPERLPQARAEAPSGGRCQRLLAHENPLVAPSVASSSAAPLTTLPETLAVVHLLTRSAGYPPTNVLPCMVMSALVASRPNRTLVPPPRSVQATLLRTISPLALVPPPTRMLGCWRVVAGAPLLKATLPSIWKPRNAPEAAYMCRP